MNRQIVRTDKAPKAVGPYSQAVVANGFVFTAGQIPLDPATGETVEGGITEQTQQVLKNLSAVLEAAGTSFEHVVKATVFLTTLDDFQAMNAVYTQYFTDNFPARSTIGNINLPRGARVEIEMVAVIPG
jgi:2-iminobutanoate/2-iminopropanoate deaminase